MQILAPANKFLVLDDRIIESIEHVHLKLGKVEKDPLKIEYSDPALTTASSQVTEKELSKFLGD